MYTIHILPSLFGKRKKGHNDCYKKGKKLLRLKAGHTLNSFLKVRVPKSNLAGETPN